MTSFDVVPCRFLQITLQTFCCRELQLSAEYSRRPILANRLINILISVVSKNSANIRGNNALYSRG